MTDQPPPISAAEYQAAMANNEPAAAGTNMAFQKAPWFSIYKDLRSLPPVDGVTPTNPKDKELWFAQQAKKQYEDSLPKKGLSGDQLETSDHYNPDTGSFANDVFQKVSHDTNVINVARKFGNDFSKSIEGQGGYGLSKDHYDAIGGNSTGPLSFLQRPLAAGADLATRAGQTGLAAYDAATRVALPDEVANDPVIQALTLEGGALGHGGKPGKGFETPAGDVVSPEARAALNTEADTLFYGTAEKAPASVEEMQQWAKSKGMKPFDDKLSAAVKARDDATPRPAATPGPVSEEAGLVRDPSQPLPVAANDGAEVPSEAPVAVPEAFSTTQAPIQPNISVPSPGAPEAFPGVPEASPVAIERPVHQELLDPAGPDYNPKNFLLANGKTAEDLAGMSDMELQKFARETKDAIDNSPFNKLSDALSKAKALSPAQKKLYSDARSEKIKSLLAQRGDVKTEEDANNLMGRLSGELPKVDFTPLRDSLTPEDVNSLHAHILNNPALQGYEVATAKSGLKKVLDGQQPNDSEINVLTKTLPPEAARSVVELTNRTKKYLPEDWLTNYHYAAMLSGYHSLEHNLVGHLFGSLVNTFNEGLSATAGSLAKLVGVKTELSTLSDFKSRLYGYGNILSDSSLYKNTKTSFVENRIVGNTDKGSWARGPQLPGILTAPERLHSASYTFFGDLEKTANLYQGASAMARKEGLSGEALRNRIDELVAKPTDELAQESLTKANAIRFMGKGDLSKAFNRFLQSPEPDQVLSRLVRFGLQNIAPFANIAEQKLLSTVRYIPGLDKLDPFARSQWKSGPAGKQAVLTRYMVGLTALAAGSQISDKSVLNSDIVYEVPVLNLIKVSHDALDQYKKLTDKSTGSEIKKASEAVFSAIATLSSKIQDETVLKSIGAYFVAQSKGDTNAGRKYLAQQLSSWVPYSAALKEITKFTDPVKRETAAPTQTDTVLNALKAETPGLSTSLPAKAPSKYDKSLEPSAGPAPISKAEYKKYQDGLAKAPPPISKAEYEASRRNSSYSPPPISKAEYEAAMKEQKK